MSRCGGRWPLVTTTLGLCLWLACLINVLGRNNRERRETLIWCGVGSCFVWWPIIMGPKGIVTTSWIVAYGVLPLSSGLIAPLWILLNTSNLLEAVTNQNMGTLMNRLSRR